MNPEEYSQLMRLGETHWWFIGTRDLLFSSVSRRLSSGKPILDVGCGSGLMMKRFAGAGRVFGIDKDQGALTHCRSVGFERLCRGDVTELPFQSGAFGLVVAADLLEHCEDDASALGELFRICAPGGILLASVPAHGALWGPHDVALHHKRRYSKRELIAKVEAAGFSIERVSYFNSVLFVPIALMRLTMAKLRPRGPQDRIKYYENLRLLGRLLLAIMRLEERLLGFVNMPFGLSILLLASKK
jgi:SAM-dependent methyltransferase